MIDLTEIRKGKDPVLRHVFISPSVVKGKVVIEARAGTVKLAWVVSKAQAKLLADLLNDAAGRAP
jgi:hypothetical protein